jgi:hypothetical protein
VKYLSVSESVMFCFMLIEERRKLGYCGVVHLGGLSASRDVIKNDSSF